MSAQAEVDRCSSWLENTDVDLLGCTEWGRTTGTTCTGGGGRTHPLLPTTDQKMPSNPVLLYDVVDEHTKLKILLQHSSKIRLEECPWGLPTATGRRRGRRPREEWE